MLCFGLLLAYCFTPSPSTSIDSFCAVYDRVIVDKGDGSINASPAVKRRLAANEVKYRCLCTGWKNPVCERP